MNITTVSEEPKLWRLKIYTKAIFLEPKLPQLLKQLHQQFIIEQNTQGSTAQLIPPDKMKVFIQQTSPGLFEMLMESITSERQSSSRVDLQKKKQSVHFYTSLYFLGNIK